MSAQATIRVTSAGNAIMHDATSSEMPGNAITMFYVDGDRLLLTHYSDAGNRPRMEGKISPDGKSVEFSFLDVAGRRTGSRSRKGAAVSERLGLDSGKPILSWLTNLLPMLAHSLSRYVFITAIGEAGGKSSVDGGTMFFHSQVGDEMNRHHGEK